MEKKTRPENESHVSEPSNPYKSFASGYGYVAVDLRETTRRHRSTAVSNTPSVFFGSRTQDASVFGSSVDTRRHGGKFSKKDLLLAAAGGAALGVTGMYIASSGENGSPEPSQCPPCETKVDGSQSQGTVEVATMFTHTGTGSSVFIPDPVPTNKAAWEGHPHYRPNAPQKPFQGSAPSQGNERSATDFFGDNTNAQTDDSKPATATSEPVSPTTGLAWEQGSIPLWTPDDSVQPVIGRQG
ncbi:hypothetical protein I316_00817 [Kwoniella heveanensis BCC8398]|uniref:Uncharacterized protein n=1 Tax=Kwoniella heveanensis BCC8398 TaxID=1296120 RepID=A0A1B9H350_9TREE|nr:hypothetical protein I316_00817 [Kwoniella heveanensis BCC8398]